MGDKYFYRSYCLLCFLITGRLMLGRWEEFLGFDEFAKRLEDILSIGGGGVTAAWDIMVAMVSLWGIPLLLVAFHGLYFLV